MSQGDLQTLQHYDDIDGSLIIDPGLEYPADGSGDYPTAWSEQGGLAALSRSTDAYSGSYCQKQTLSGIAGLSYLYYYADVTLPLGALHEYCKFQGKGYFKINRSSSTDASIYNAQLYLQTINLAGSFVESVYTDIPLIDDVGYYATNWNEITTPVLTITDISSGTLSKVRLAVNINKVLAGYPSSSAYNIKWDLLRMFQTYSFSYNPNIRNIKEGYTGESSLRTASGNIQINNLQSTLYKKQFQMEWRMMSKSDMFQLRSLHSFRNKKLKWTPHLDAMRYAANPMSLKWTDSDFQWAYESANIENGGYRIQGTFEEV